jgi:hypothetical protein
MTKSAGMFFSVSVPMKIDGVLYRPSVCYSVPARAEKAVGDLVKGGRARLYQEEVRFISGVAHPVNKPAAPSPEYVQSTTGARSRRSHRTEF